MEKLIEFIKFQYDMRQLQGDDQYHTDCTSIDRYPVVIFLFDEICDQSILESGCCHKLVNYH